VRALGQEPTRAIAPSELRSGKDFVSPETRAQQEDLTANPGMLWVLDGEALWKSKAGATGKACADCHNDARTSMKGVAARYPAFDKTLDAPLERRAVQEHAMVAATAAEADIGTQAHDGPFAATARVRLAELHLLDLVSLPIELHLGLGDGFLEQPAIVAQELGGLRSGRVSELLREQLREFFPFLLFLHDVARFRDPRPRPVEFSFPRPQ